MSSERKCLDALAGFDEKYAGIKALLAASGLVSDELMGDLDRSFEKIVEAREELEEQLRPASLVIRRTVLNADDIVKWFGDRGITVSVGPVVVASSPVPVVWSDIGRPCAGTIVSTLGPRGFHRIGHMLYLTFTNHLINNRRRSLDLFGMISSQLNDGVEVPLGQHDDMPPITDLYLGPIVLGPEIWCER